MGKEGVQIGRQTLGSQQQSMKRMMPYMNQQKTFENMRITETPKITVAIRKRPLNKKEIQRSETDIVRVGSGGQVTISEYKQKVDLTKYLEETTFNFDFAYDENSNNEEIYEQSIRPLIENAFMGAKISCFAYGQTGSGKTFTMKGDVNRGVPGLYYLGAKEIFNMIEQPQFRHLHVTVSFYEIYCGRLHDLLNNRAELKIREDKKQNINVIGLEEKTICSAEEFLDVIEYGSSFRVTSQNATNADSSRSHAILQISLKHDKKVFTKISFIDLAGNERGADHMDQNKQTKIDGAEINKSLLSLKECIRALDMAKSHTPFRGSKLTMVLKDSFVGFCNTVMICNVSPNVSASENTLNTLRYADRVKELKRSDQGQSLTRQEMLSRELMLPRANNKNCVKVNIENTDDNEDIMNKMEHARMMQQNGRNRYEEDKMEIEEPYENKRPVMLMQVGRKTENLSNDLRLFNNDNKRFTGAGSRDLTRPNKSGGMDLQPSYRGRDIIQQNDKQPLLSRNVPNLEIDQNNLNFGNNSQPIDFNKRTNKPVSITLANPNPNIALNRSQFEAMNTLKDTFNQYREEQGELMKEEMALMQQEGQMKNHFKLGVCGNSYEEEIDTINDYMIKMEKIANKKIELYNICKANIERIRGNIKNAEELTARMRFEQQNEMVLETPPQIPRQNNIFMNPSGISGININNNLNQNVNYNMGGYHNNHNGMNSNLYSQSSNHSGIHNQNMGHLSSNVMGCRSQTKLHLHSSMAAMNFNGFNNHMEESKDEQLLEGLPGDESMSRLF